MKLQEKIYRCRKKAGYSQETLAGHLGVSRQAISKWENGDAEPEIAKLKLLAQVFDVTTDWLLSEDAPEKRLKKERSTYSSFTMQSTGSHPNWVESLPDTIGMLIKKFGWLFGVYVAASGAGLFFMGVLARYMTRQMFSNFMGQPTFEVESMFSEPLIVSNTFGNAVSSAGTNNPVFIMGSFMVILGIVLMLIGITLVVVLKKNSKEE